MILFCFEILRLSDAVLGNVYLVLCYILWQYGKNDGLKWGVVESLLHTREIFFFTAVSVPGLGALRPNSKFLTGE
jgi:hypothetical protein